MAVSLRTSDFTRTQTVSVGATNLAGTGAPGAAANDYYIACVMLENQVAHTLSPPAGGWALLTPDSGNNPQDAGAASTFKFYCYAILRGASDPSFNFTWTTGLASPSDYAEVNILCVSGADSVSALSSVVHIVVGAGTATASIDPPAITPPVSASLIIAGGFTWDSWAGTPTAPSGYTICATSGGGNGTSYAFKAQASGTENPGVFSNAGASNQTVGFTISVSPAGASLGAQPLEAEPPRRSRSLVFPIVMPIAPPPALQIGTIAHQALPFSRAAGRANALVSAESPLIALAVAQVRIPESVAPVVAQQRATVAVQQPARPLAQLVAPTPVVVALEPARLQQRSAFRARAPQEDPPPAFVLGTGGDQPSTPLAASTAAAVSFDDEQPVLLALTPSLGAYPVEAVTPLRARAARPVVRPEPEAVAALPIGAFPLLVQIGIARRAFTAPVAEMPPLALPIGAQPLEAPIAPSRYQRGPGPVALDPPTALPIGASPLDAPMAPTRPPKGQQPVAYDPPLSLPIGAFPIETPAPRARAARSLAQPVVDAPLPQGVAPLLAWLDDQPAPPRRARAVFFLPVDAAVTLALATGQLPLETPSPVATRPPRTRPQVVADLVLPAQSVSLLPWLDDSAAFIPKRNRSSGAQPFELLVQVALAPGAPVLDAVLVGRARQAPLPILQPDAAPAALVAALLPWVAPTAELLRAAVARGVPPTAGLVPSGFVLGAFPLEVPPVGQARRGSLPAPLADPAPPAVAAALLPWLADVSLAILRGARQAPFLFAEAPPAPFPAPPDVPALLRARVATVRAPTVEQPLPELIRGWFDADAPSLRPLGARVWRIPTPEIVVVPAAAASMVVDAAMLLRPSVRPGQRVREEPRPLAALVPATLLPWIDYEHPLIVAIHRPVSWVFGEQPPVLYQLVLPPPLHQFGTALISITVLATGVITLEPLDE